MQNQSKHNITFDTQLKTALSVVKPKPKLLHQPITTNTNYPMNQSELEANTRNQRQERENACEQVGVRDWFEFYF